MTNIIPLPRAITVQELADVVLNVTPEQVEKWVDELPTEQVAGVVIRAEAIRKMFSVAAKAGERRLEANGYVGQTYTENGTAYRFSQDYRKKWQDIPGMADALLKEGFPLRAIFEATSDLRVTSLREATKSLPDEQAANALDILEEFRQTVKSAPSFVEVDDHGRPVHR